MSVATEKHSRIFLVAKYIWAHCDETHYVTIHEIQDYLTANGIVSDRKTISRDIEFLSEIGFEIDKENSTQSRYRLKSHYFNSGELRLLKDAVQSSRFISESETRDLIAKLSFFESDNHRKKTLKYKFVEKYPKAENDRILAIIDGIEDAIESNTKIVFQYTACSPEKRTVLRHNGAKYVLSPYNTIWKNDNYYVIGYDEAHDGIIGTYRIDRIRNLENTDLRAFPKPADYSPAIYHEQVFSMRTGETTEVQLLCDNELMQDVVERFGKNIKTVIVDKEHFKAYVKVSVESTFFGWLVSYGGKMKLIGPQQVADEYKTVLENCLIIE